MKKLLILLVLTTFAMSNSTEKIALLIGNSEYKFQSLNNPLHDVDGLYKTLLNIGFKKSNIKVLKNASKYEMDKAIKRFSQKARDAKIALTYFSGHGMQVNNINYIFPAKTTAKKPTDLDGLVRLKYLINGASNAKYGIILVDACRNNPLVKHFQGGKSKGFLAKKGLGQVLPNHNQIIIGFATGIGEIADDGMGDMSPYALALSKWLKKPIDIRNVLGKVGEEVSATHEQNPIYKGTLSTNLCLAGSCVHQEIKRRREKEDSHTPKKYKYIGSINWRDNAYEYKDNLGQVFVFECLAQGKISNQIWGTDRYYSSSSICTTAVHAGKITAKDGGVVTIKIMEKTDRYLGTNRHGVDSIDYRNKSSNYIFLDNPINIKRKYDKGKKYEYIGSINWRDNAYEYKDNLGQVFVFECLAQGKISNQIWGTDRYYSSSSICTTAVHAGKITAKDGGVVTIKIMEKTDRYLGSERNEISSLDYRNYVSSYIFVDNPVNIKRKYKKGKGYKDVGVINWRDTAYEYKDNLGQVFVFKCLSQGKISNQIWGTDIYTIDSSICNAGVHTGKITVTKGGVVAIKIKAGENRYIGRKRHGIESRNYRKYGHTSFLFVDKPIH